MRDELLGDQRVGAVDVLGAGRDLLLGELAHGGAHLLGDLVERRLVGARASRRRAARSARNTDSLPARRSGGARLGGEGRVERLLAEAEVVDGVGQAVSQARGQVGHRGRADPLEVLVAAAFGAHGGREVEQLPGGAPFGGGVGDALGEHLVIVDPLAVRR